VKITVIVPTYKRPDFVVRTITSLAEQTLAPNQIIVVDNAPTDESKAVVSEMRSTVRGLRHLAEPRLGVSVARNRAVEEATGELVAFIDDDAVASPRWLQALVEGVRRTPQAVAVAGPIGLRWSRTSPAWVHGLESWYGDFNLGEQRKQIEYPLYPFASNLAFRREAFLSVGGFPVELGPRGERRISNEEDGLFRRVAERGWPVVYEPGALVYHWVHADRLYRRYLLRRGFAQGRSDVLADALFSRRSRGQRVQRSAAAAVAAVDAGLVAVTKRKEKHASMRALVAVSMSLGSAVQDAGLSVATRGPRELHPAGAPQATDGLTIDQLDQFDRDGFVRVRAGFDGADAMADRLWEHLARRGIDRNDTATWPSGKAHHLQKLLREPVFMPIGGPATTAAIDDLLGPGRWVRPEHWGEFLVNFPEPRRQWIVPTLWHSDAAYTDPLKPPLGVMVFSFLNRVDARGGGTLLLAGSHRLVARFAADRPSLSSEKTPNIRRAFYQSHPWLSALVANDGDRSSFERFTEEADVGGVPARVVELTGDPGDIVISHPLIAHCVSPNCARQPRFMRITRPRLRTELVAPPGK
jgi:GT2 family glycosyltransferase